MVWAVDAEHAPLFWFPRDCPRVTVWPRGDDERTAFREAWHTTAPRVHAIETRWLDRLRTTTIHRYDFDDGPFVPWPEASGYEVAREAVEPIACEPIGDLLALHVDAGIELRVVPSIWPLVDLAVSGPWDFSIARKHNAQPRQRGLRLSLGEVDEGAGGGGGVEVAPGQVLDAGRAAGHGDRVQPGSGGHDAG